MKSFVALIVLTMGGFVISNYIELQNNNVDSILALKIPKCKEGDSACISHTFTRFCQNSDMYHELNIPKFTPFIPKKPFDSLIMQEKPEIGLGISFDGHASNISIYGFDKAIVRNLEGMGPNLGNTNIKWNFFVPTFTFYSSVLTANMRIFSGLTSSTDFVMNLTATSVSLAVNMESSVILRNEKHYLKVQNLKVKILDLNYSIDLHSKSLSPLMNGLVNSVMNYFIFLQSEFENYAACLIGSLIELTTDKLAIQDYFQ